MGETSARSSSEIASGGNGNNFCLRWNDYTTSLKSAFTELRDSEKDLFDISLICDGHELRAHRLILSACSRVLRRVISTARGAPSPTILLWDISSADMEALLTFMYEGEVYVSEAQLESFFAAAERLQVKGLTHGQAVRPGNVQEVQKQKQRVEAGSDVEDGTDEDEGENGESEVDESAFSMGNVSTELSMADQPLVIESGKESSALSDETLGKDGLCNFCQKQFKTKSHARTHMADLHFPVPTQCPNCLKVFASRPKMMRHRSKMCKVQGWVPPGGEDASPPPPQTIQLPMAPPVTTTASVSPKSGEKRSRSGTRSGKKQQLADTSEVLEEEKASQGTQIEIKREVLPSPKKSRKSKGS